jgi:hypothetical protein
MQTDSYIACPICSKNCRGRLIKHLVVHGYVTEESFLKDYPSHPLETDAWKNAKIKISKKAKERLKDKKEREKISAATKLAMSRPEVRKNFEAAVCKPLSEETKRKMAKSISAALANPEVKKKMYTLERNRKISEKKKLYWDNNPAKKKRVGETWKKVRDKDPEKWKKHLLEISRKGFEVAWGKKETSLESKYYEILQSENIEYIPQYELSGKLYDAYLPRENVLLEFDGEFWHPKSLQECRYDWQINNYHNDREKDEIAKTRNIKLIRIREDSPVDSIKGLLHNIYNK